MKFICGQCESALVNDPMLLYEFWQNAIDQGRIHINAHQFDNAILFYGNAFEASELMLPSTTFSRQAIDRFIRTGMEFLFALRKGGFLNDLDALIATVEQSLKSTRLPKTVAWYIQPLKDVADKPMCAVEVWMQSILKTPTLEPSSALH